MAPGTIEKQSVSLILDKSVEASDVAELRNAVEAAAGIDAERGDVLNVSQVEFAKAEEVKPSPVSGALGMLKYVGLGLATLIFLILLSRQLKKRENDQLTGEPLWLREIQAPADAGAAGGGHAGAHRPRTTSSSTRATTRLAESARSSSRPTPSGSRTRCAPG